MIINLIKKHGARCVIYFISFILLMGAWWIKRNFGSPTIDQIIYHLQYGSEGLEDTDSRMLYSFIAFVIAVPFFLTIILFSIQQLFVSEAVLNFIKHSTLRRENNFIHKNIAAIYLLTKKSFRHLIPISFFIVSIFIFSNQISLWSHLTNLEPSDFIDNTYIAPTQITGAENKTNLVLIYVESLENGYSDAHLMGRDLLASLNKTTENSYSFQNFEQTTGTNWTVAGMISTQCGVPFKLLAPFDPNTQGEKIKSFLPGIKCLGDVLSEQGYKNIFLGGASLHFAGKGKFLAQHGYSELYGKEEWSQYNPEDFNGWGLNDDALFEQAKQKLKELEAQKQPFNLTLLTVNMHSPDGFFSNTCPQEKAIDFKGIVTCTSDLVSDFVIYMKQKGYLKNTVVVIIGDHLAMPNPVSNALKSNENRTIYNRILTPDILKKNRETIYHFSMYPTILYAMGFRFKKNRLGIGASGFGSLDPDFPTPYIKPKTMNNLLKKSSKKYLEFWQIPEAFK